MKDVKIFASIIEDEAKIQINEMSECEAYKDCKIRIMPDCHAGSGCTIGTVIQTKDKIVPNTVGVDIGCGMLVVNLGKIDLDLKELDEVINENIPSGKNHNDVLRVDVRGASSKYKYIFDKLYDDMKMPNIDAFGLLYSLGSLGGGNHFIEIDTDNEGNKYLVIHTGSRNLGTTVCKHYQDLAVKNLKHTDVKEIIEKLKSEGRQKEIESVLKSLPKNNINKELAYVEGDTLNDYLNDMCITQQFASINRWLIAHVILKEMGLTEVDSFETIHNYINIRTKVLRKGAISAELGERVLIPMNMRDGSLICVGKGNYDWICSAPHGAGRIMSRRKAKETLSMNEFTDEMKNIYTTSVCEETIDESPMAYKSSDVIKEDIKDTVDIVKVIKPIYNFKAKE